MIVIKIGGGKGIDLKKVATDLSSLSDQVVLIHGGNYFLDEYGKKLGYEKKTLTSPTGLVSRHTNREVIELMFLTYAGLVNKKLVEELQRVGTNAIGLSGIDGRLILGKKHEGLVAVEEGKKVVIKDDFTGSVESINTFLLQSLLKQGLVPVITPPVLTSQGEVINVDGDKIASKIASTLHAEKVIFLTESGGIFKDKDDPKTLIREANKQALVELLEVSQGRMKRKVLECKKLLEEGVKEIMIALTISDALSGGGTHICEA